MAGDNKLQANADVYANNVYANNITGGIETDQQLQTTTPAATSPVLLTQCERKPAGPFDFRELTSGFKIDIIKNGITKNQLEAVKSETDLNYFTLSSLLSVSRTTLIKKKGDEKFDQPTSERILLLAEFISFGMEVLESRERFNSWLKDPCVALGNKPPLELIDTFYGIEEVKKELSRIKYSVY